MKRKVIRKTNYMKKLNNTLCSCMGVWLYICMVVWLYICMGVWLYGCIFVWLCEYVKLI